MTFKVVYHLLGETGWLTVIVNGTRQIPMHSLHFSLKVGSKAMQAKRPGTSKNKQNGTPIFHSEIPFGNFGLPFKKCRFSERMSVQGDKINPIHSIRNFRSFWVNGRQP